MAGDTPMVLVPETPTEAMLQAGYKAYGATLYSHAGDRQKGWGENAADIYRAMLSASPAREGSKPTGEQIVCGNDWQRRMLDPSPGEGDAPVAGDGSDPWWRTVIGGEHKPSGEIASIKHMHPLMVKPIYEAHKGTAVADVIAGLVFKLSITQERERFLVEHANERAEAAEDALEEHLRSRPTPATPEGLREKVARATALALYRQEYGPDSPEPPQLFDWGDYCWSYVDQGTVDFLAVADAILSALQPQGGEG